MFATVMQPRHQFSGDVWTMCSVSTSCRLLVPIVCPGVRPQLHVRSPRGVRAAGHPRAAPLASVRVHQDEHVLSEAAGRQPAGARRDDVRALCRVHAGQGAHHDGLLASWRTGK